MGDRSSPLVRNARGVTLGFKRTYGGSPPPSSWYGYAFAPRQLAIIAELRRRGTARPQLTCVSCPHAPVALLPVQRCCLCWEVCSSIEVPAADTIFSRQIYRRVWKYAPRRNCHGLWLHRLLQAMHQYKQGQTSVYNQIHSTRTRSWPADPQRGQTGHRRRSRNQSLLVTSSHACTRAAVSAGQGVLAMAVWKPWGVSVVSTALGKAVDTVEWVTITSTTALTVARVDGGCLVLMQRRAWAPGSTARRSPRYLCHTEMEQHHPCFLLTIVSMPCASNQRLLLIASVLSTPALVVFRARPLEALRLHRLPVAAILVAQRWG